MASSRTTRICTVIYYTSILAECVEVKQRNPSLVIIQSFVVWGHASEIGSFQVVMVHPA